MRIAQRLFVAVIPAVLGVLAMAGLAYWGQRGRQIPEWLLAGGVMAAVASLALAWHNTRYVARRVEALAGRQTGAAGTRAPGPDDELDSIERTIAEAERRGETREHAAEALVREYAGLLADASATVGHKLDDVRLPLHILLSSPFGELNENQEEMIGAAQTAAEDADDALRLIGRIVALDAGRVQSQPRRIRLRDLLQPVLSAAGPRLQQAGASLEVDLAPMLPPLHVDPQQVREAVSLILARLSARATQGSRLRVVAEPGDGLVALRIFDASLQSAEAFPLAQRLIRLQDGGVASQTEGALEILLPTSAMRA